MPEPSSASFALARRAAAGGARPRGVGTRRRVAGSTGEGNVEHPAQTCARRVGGPEHDCVVTGLQHDGLGD